MKLIDGCDIVTELLEDALLPAASPASVPVRDVRKDVVHVGELGQLSLDVVIPLLMVLDGVVLLDKLRAQCAASASARQTGNQAIPGCRCPMDL